MFIVLGGMNTHEPDDGYYSELDKHVGHTNYDFLAPGQLSLIQIEAQRNPPPENEWRVGFSFPGTKMQRTRKKDATSLVVMKFGGTSVKRYASHQPA